MSKPVPATAWLDGELAEALAHAVTDSRDNRANFIRRLLAEWLRDNGYMPGLPTLRRPSRIRRRPEAA